MATCEALNTSGLVNPPSLTLHGTVEYGQTVEWTCHVPGRGRFNRSRTCLYNKRNGKYELLGDPIECGGTDLI